ncbi:ankyrin [Colletotrichum caudatum]|nr:ankyrin [Colletotrichum caudatum]
MSASPSSSHATQTGRPSLWSDSSERKLARLYVYTTLPLKKIVEVVHKSTPGNKDCPGKDSANKKLNSILDKEPRWLHPRTRTDMDRRISALESSPTRQTTPENVFSASSYSRSISSDINSRLSANPGFKHETGNSPNLHDFQPFRHSRSSSAGWGPLPAEPLPTLMTSGFASAPPPEIGIRRQSTTLTLQEVLSQYSTGFIRQVDKLLKRYTMPTNTMRNPNPSPMDEDRPATADSNPASWIFEDNAPRGNSDPGAKPLPGDFLNLHRHMSSRGFCTEGLPEHDSRSCFCHVSNELTEESWVTKAGPSPYARHVFLTGAPPDGRLDSRDAFGNTVLHLLAAGEAHHDHLLRAVQLSRNPSATNSAGQTFLHVLNDSWFSHKARSLFRLLECLKYDNFLYARDVYGRNFCHVLHSKGSEILDQDTKNFLLNKFDAMEYCRRDAFGHIPESAPIGLPVRRAYTAAVGQEMSPAWDSRTLRQVSSPIEQQAALLRLVNEAYENPRVQDTQGRNGLHCLADAILSKEALLAKFAQYSDNTGAEGQQPTASTRKRKYNKPVLDKSLSDSSRDRLTVRERIVMELIELGVDPNHYDKYGNTVLMAFAAQLPEDDDYKKPVEILEVLIKAGANVNARNRNGETALHIAVRRGKKLAMRTLAQNGANPQARDGEGRSVLEVADRMVTTSSQNIQYSHYEACHAWLSGQAKAVQSPTIHQEWELGES